MAEIKKANTKQTADKTQVIGILPKSLKTKTTAKTVTIKKKKPQKEKVLEVKNLSVQFPIGEGKYFNATKSVDFDVYKGEVVGLVGESGSGKSTTAKAIMGLVEHSTGHVKISNEIVPNTPKQVKGRVNKWLASKVQMIFQDAKSSLNPREKVYDVIVEGAKNQKLFEKSKDAIQIELGTKWVADNQKRFQDAIYYSRIKNIISFMKKNKEAREKYELSYATLFTAYDDQRVIVQSLKNERRTKIREAKTLYKFAKKAKYSLEFVKAQINIKKYIDMRFVTSTHERTIVNKILLAKLKYDIGQIQADFDKRHPNQVHKLKVLKARFNNQKRPLKHRRNTTLATIKKEWTHYKKITRKYYKSSLKNLNSKSAIAKKEWEAHKKEHEDSFNKKAFYREVVNTAMKKVSMSPEFVNRFPGEFSGGQAQRIAIARTIAMNTDLIIADEPISALDVSIQAQVINLLKDLIKKQKLTILFIAHDLQVVRYISDRIVVMFKGELVEQGPADMVYKNPIHPYTKSLVNAVPSIDNPERLKDSQAYKSEIMINFFNYKDVKKTWANVNAKGHMIYGTDEQTKRWIKESKKRKK